MLTCAFFCRHLGSKVMAGSLAHTHVLAHKLHESDSDTDRHSLKELIHIHAISHARTRPGVPLKQRPKHRCMQLLLRLSTRTHRSPHSHPTYAWSVFKTTALLLLSLKWLIEVFEIFFFECVCCVFWLFYMHVRAQRTQRPARTEPVNGTLQPRQKSRPKMEQKLFEYFSFLFVQILEFLTFYANIYLISFTN